MPEVQVYLSADSTAAPRRHNRLGFGEYTWPGADPQTAKSYFVGAIHDHAPEVLRDLADQPWSVYKSAGIVNFQDWMDFEMWATGRLTTLKNPAWPSLRDAVLTWRRRWGLDAAWCLELAMYTLRNWYGALEVFHRERDPATDETLRHWSPAATAIAVIPVIFSEEELANALTLPTWAPHERTFAEADRQIRAAFEAHHMAYMARMRQIAGERGLTPTVEKRRIEHFEWLVRFQVQGWTYARIARTCLVEYLGDPKTRESTVRDVVPKLAAAVGLPLRPARPGRPRKSG